MRWQRILEELGHHVAVVETWAEQACDLLVAIHARKSAPSVDAFATRHPGAPIVLLLAGTDVYPDLRTGGVEERILRLATRILVLQPLAVLQVPEDLRQRTLVMVQSVEPLDRETEPPSPDAFEVAVLAHLRPVKDPFRAAEAVRLLGDGSRIQVLHMGAARSPDMAERARAETASNPRYRWLGELPRSDALRIVARCQLLVLTSLHEGGANAVSEAVVAGVPVLSSRVDGSVGLLGADYPGYFEVGDTEGLCDLLQRAERNVDGLHDDLRRRCAELRPLFDPAAERARWQGLLAELS